MQNKLEYKLFNSGKEARFNYCPICQKENKNNPCFSVNLETGTYFCHSKSKGGILAELEGYKDIKFNGASFQNDAPEKKANFKGVINNSTSLNDEWLEYFKNRGIDLEYDRLKKIFRLTRGGKKLIIPLTDGDELVGLKYRTLDKKFESASGSRSDYLINWKNVNDFAKNYGDLIICEGEIDLISFMSVGFENVVSLPFGAGNVKCIENQIEFIKKFEKVIIATDNDEAGINGREKIIDILQKNNIDKISYLDFKEHNDANEVLEKEGKKALEKIIKKDIPVKKKINKNEYEGEFIIKNNSYYTWNSKGFYEKLSNFTVEIIGHSHDFIHGISTLNNGAKKEFKNKTSELMSKENISKNIGLFFVDL